MDTAEVFQKLQSQFGDEVTTVEPEVGDPWIEVSPDALTDVCRSLRDEPSLAFNLLNCISGVDYYVTIKKKGSKAEFEPHLEVLYHLSSLKHKHRLVLKVKLPRWKDDTEGQPPELATVSDIWSTADWHEREVFDLVGVQFTGHPDLRRILCPEDWAGHPLRKDYQMPTEYHGIRTR
jgi:NADH-quinone oxidoreductase subunit C